MAEQNLTEKIGAIRELLQIFKFERIVYLAVTIISLLLLLASAIALMIKGKAGSIELVGLFGSAGAITYTAGRLLRMWAEALRVLYPAAKEEQ